MAKWDKTRFPFWEPPRFTFNYSRGFGFFSEKPCFRLAKATKQYQSRAGSWFGGMLTSNLESLTPFVKGDVTNCYASWVPANPCRTIKPWGWPNFAFFGLRPHGNLSLFTRSTPFTDLFVLLNRGVGRVGRTRLFKKFDRVLWARQQRLLGH